MSTHRYIDRICWAALALVLAATALLMNGGALGLQSVRTGLGYESRLFDSTRVHTIDIVMDNWEEFLETCENEEYAACALVIDGEACRNAGIRAKGNTSLSSVAAYGNDRYSFKVEFDHYDSAGSYYGLDKLSLNNLIQDNTCMKDFLVYQLMGEFGVASPLCSYVYLTVNGEAWGLYLAVEGVEEAFLRRNYGAEAGALYKPDSLSFGGGRGNGGGFDPADFAGVAGADLSAPPDRPDFSGGAPRWPEAGDRGAPAPPEGGDFPGNMGGGMGSSDVKLQYIDDDPDSYPNIFDNAKTPVTDADKTRLIAALKTLGGEDADQAVDVDQVLRYFVVHGFVCNGDSYTGSMVHNYYLYEQDGRLAMIPWDYNLAFGGFQPGDAAGTVNEPIDTPVTGGNLEDRPMAAWIFRSEAYTDLYHQYYSQFLAQCLDSGLCQELIDRTRELIAPYVAEDPTKFCTYEEFEAGAAALRSFCQLRSESVRGQLAGTIPSTSQGQAADASALVDAAGLRLADMGSMTQGGGPGGGPGAAEAWKPGDGEPASAPARPDRGSPGGNLGGGPAERPGARRETASGWQALAASAALLLAGLALAKRFPRRRHG